MKNQSPDELGAAEAARLLGVKLPTLYAYVSRGLLRSLPNRSGRARAASPIASRLGQVATASDAARR